MKHVRGLQAEPPLLGDYCLLRQSGANRSAKYANDVWKRFKKHGDNAYQQVLSLLVDRQQGLCMYCERLVVDNSTASLEQDSYLVEHVLPKSGASGRVLDWKNLGLSCWARYTTKQDKTCADAKTFHNLPPGLDPRQLPLSPSLLNVSSDGLLKPNIDHCERYGVNVDALGEAIKLLNLNYEPLRVKRQEVRDTLRKEFFLLLTGLRGKGLAETEVTMALYALVSSRLSPAGDQNLLREFWTTERIELDVIAESWIAANSGLFQ